MATYFINPILAAFISMGFFGLLFLGIFYGVRKLNKVISNVRLRRKLAAAKMVSEAKQD